MERERRAAVGDAGEHVAAKTVGAQKEETLLFVGHVETEQLGGHSNFTPKLIFFALRQKAGWDG